jgi:phage regulator Rha-like protein
MSSREIADLVEKRHDVVKLSIERLAERAVIQLPPLMEVKNHLGQAVQEYQVGKRDSYIIVAQLSPEFTARLVDRWQELYFFRHVPVIAGLLPCVTKWRG